MAKMPEGICACYGQQYAVRSALQIQTCIGEHLSRHRAGYALGCCACVALTAVDDKVLICCLPLTCCALVPSMLHLCINTDGVDAS